MTKYILLDTRSINYCAANPDDKLTKSFVGLISDLQVVPFLTFHQIEEIAGHENEEVFSSRIRWIKSLPHIAYIKQNQEQYNIGNINDLREYELEYLLNHNSPQESKMLKSIRPKVLNGFCSGNQLVNDNLDFWILYRERFSDWFKAEKEEISNLTHFDLSNPKEKLPKANTPISIGTEKSSAIYFERAGLRLAEKIQQRGHIRSIDPQYASLKLMQEAHEETLGDIESGVSTIDSLLERHGILRERLPRKPTVEDSGYESIFTKQLAIHARRMRRTHGELLAKIRKEQLPSWVVWQQLHSRSKQTAKASIGNINDRSLAAFGPYVDILDVDKRTAEFLRQGASTHPLIKTVFSKVPPERGFSGLINYIENCI